jgi:hypothetical protein
LTFPGFGFGFQTLIKSCRFPKRYASITPPAFAKTGNPVIFINGIKELGSQSEHAAWSSMCASKIPTYGRKKFDFRRLPEPG